MHQELDHKNLNDDVLGLRHRPITTESIAQYIHERATATLPIHRVRLHERDDFFAEHWSDERSSSECVDVSVPRIDCN